MRHYIYILLFFYSISFCAKAQNISVNLGATSYCSNATANPIAIPFTVSGGTFTLGNLFTAELSDASGSFTSPVVIGNLIGTTSGTISGTIPAGIPLGTNYRIRILASIPTRTSINTSAPVSITNPTGNPTTFGNNEWLAYAYQGDIINAPGAAAYHGYYTDNSLNFDSRTKWAENGSPSQAPGYQGCGITINNHSVSYKRRGFPCGFYSLGVVGFVGNTNGHDDAYQLLVDGVIVAGNGGCCAPRPDVWRGILGPNSTVEMRWQEGGGSSYGALQLTAVSGDLMINQPTPTICATTSATLSVVPALNNANYSFTWSGPLGFTATGPSITTPIGRTGIYTVTATRIGSGCSTVTGSVDVQNPAPPNVALTASSTNVCIGESVNLSATGATTYRWFNAATGGTQISTAANITVNPTTTTTYRVEGRDGCSPTPSIRTVTINVTPAGIDPGTFGNNQWFVACYQGNNFNNYFGNYTESSLNFDSRNRWNNNGSPSSASGYTGTCIVPNDQHSVIYRRTNFACGYYQIDVPSHNDDAFLYIDGVEVWRFVGCCATRNNIWRGFLGSASRVEFRWREFGGGSHGALNFTEISSSFSPITSALAVTICEGSSTTITYDDLPISSVTGSPNASVAWSVVAPNQPSDFTFTPGANSVSVRANVTPVSNPARIRYTATHPLTGCSISRDVLVTVNPLPNTSISANLTTVCRNEPVILTATGANIYQWFDAPTGGNLIGSGASITINPSITTTYRVEGNNNCATLAATITINVIQPGLTGNEYGNGEWIAHAYNGLLLTNPVAATYRGNYRESSISFTSTSRWTPSANPSIASGYSGCTVNNDQHSISFRRTNFDCGYYEISVGRDDAYRLLINGTVIASSNSAGFSGNVWSGLLDASSTVELITQDNSGNSYGQLSIAFSTASVTNTFWTGRINSDWFNPGNWCPAVPNNNTDVTIPGAGVPNMPIISASGAVCKNIIITTGATLNIQNSFALTVFGNWLNQGNLQANTSGTINMEGNTLQNVGSGNKAFAHLNINKPGGVVRMNSEVSTRNLTLTRGGLDLNTYSLTIANPSPSAITRLNQAYIRSETNSANNTSRVCWQTNASTGLYTYPFGVSESPTDGYIPVTFNKLTPTATDLCISTRATLLSDNLPYATGVTHVTGVGGATAAKNVIDRWWDISSSVDPLPFPGANVIFSYRPNENTIDNPFSFLVIQHYNTAFGDWDMPYAGGSTGILSGIGQVGGTNLTSFSPHVIVTLPMPLPVKFIRFDVNAVENKQVHLYWETTPEDEAEKFIVERSQDARNFVDIGQISAQREGSENKKYTYTDSIPLEGVGYYRIKQIATNGEVLYTSIESINIFTQKPMDVMLVVPNPTTPEGVNIFLQSLPATSLKLSVIDATGREIYTQKGETDAQGQWSEKLQMRLPAGIYIATLKTSEALYQKKIVVR